MANDNSSGDIIHFKYKIRVTENGPYEITGSLPLISQIIDLDDEGKCLAWHETSRYPRIKNYSLCRCGKSQHKPFCDNTHKRIYFDGTETASRERYIDICQKYTGPTIDLTDARILCADAGFCERAGGIWGLIERSGDEEARKTAVEEAFNCPSGRLVVRDKEGKAMEPLLEPSIVIAENPTTWFIGPVWVRGGIPIESANGTAYEIRNRVTLCGCGRSSNKPFCDGSHRK
jgi:CDGSH-type Zn-finger protein